MQLTGHRARAEAAGGTTADGTTANGSTGPMQATPSVLPATGIGAAGPDVRLGDLGGQLGLPASGRLLSGRPAEPATRSWTLTPSIGLTEQYATGNSGGSGSIGSNQVLTTVQPGLVGSGDTTRLHAELSYTPQILFYSRDGHQNQVDQTFDARLLATLLPGTAFLDLRGAGTVQAINVGQAPNQTGTLARGESTQSVSVSATPYVLHRFGPWGTGELGGTVARTTQSALQTGLQTAGTATPEQQLAALAEASNQNTTTTSAHLAFTTGEAFARYNGAALAQATNFAGGGVLDGAYRDVASLDSGYGLTRTITALAMFGWERIHYSGTSPLHLNEAIWNVGVRLVPNADSSITLRYGRKDGLNSLTVDGAYQPTVRTRVYVRYSSGLTTQSEQLQNVLATSDLDSQGNPVDHATGAPLVGASNFFGVQNSLYKTTLASLTGVLLLDRDSFSASLTSQTQTLVSASNATALANGSSRGTYGSLTWTHLLRPNLQSTFFAQYGVQNGGQIGFAETGLGRPTGDEQLLVLSASLSYALSPTLSGSAQYSYNQTFGSQSQFDQPGNASGGQSLVLVSLIKSF